jgi:hypothetical protein
MEIIIILGIGLFLVAIIFKLKGYFIFLFGMLLAYFTVFEPEEIKFMDIDKGFLLISASMLIIGGFIIATLDGIQKKLKNETVEYNPIKQNTEKAPVSINNIVKIIGVIVAVFFILPLILNLFGSMFYYSSPVVILICIIVLVIVIVLLLLIIKRLKNNEQKNVFRFIIEEIKKMVKNKKET